MIVIGDGPTGFEFVYIFNALNIDVTWLVLPGGPSCAILRMPTHPWSICSGGETFRSSLEGRLRR